MKFRFLPMNDNIYICPECDKPTCTRVVPLPVPGTNDANWCCIQCAQTVYGLVVLTEETKENDMGNDNLSQGGNMAKIASNASLRINQVENSAKAMNLSTDAVQVNKEMAADMANRAADQLRAEGW